MRHYSGMYYLLKEIDKKKIYIIQYENTYTTTYIYTYNVYTSTTYEHTKPGTRVDKCT